MTANVFNQNSRTDNARKASIAGVVNQISKIVLSFVYRTVFLLILTKEYLGLDGLFTNILNILQLAELGIGTAIVFRMYKPIQQNDVEKVAALMNFYKWVYRIIAITVTVIGLALMPCLKFFIKDMSEVPSDINIYLLYALFLVQTVASYLFVYRQSMLSADQKNYSVSLFSILTTVVKYGVMLLVLAISKKYLLTLGLGIAATLLVNYIISLIVKRQYSEVFKRKNKLTKEEMKTILKDTGGMLCHKIGATIVFSTDSLLISAFLGTGLLGIYSNYSLIITSVTGLLAQLIGSFVASLGNMSVESDDAHKVQVYKRLLYFNNWFVCFCTVCLLVLLNPFIYLWQDETMVLPIGTVIALCGSFFISNSRCITNSYVNASGLFNKDRLRPFIESAINLVASILLVKSIGITGIFVGTIISSVCTSWWREPYILHKYELHYSVKSYWLRYAFSAFITAGSCAATYFLCTLFDYTVTGFIIRLAVCLVLPNLILALTTFYTDDFKFYLNLVLRKLHLKKG